jgi:hypothetical protein
MVKVKVRITLSVRVRVMDGARLTVGSEQVSGSV